MTLDDPPPRTPKLRLIGTVWGVVGLVAVVVGALATVFAIAVFGGIAIVLGVALYAAQGARERSARDTARTLSGDPVPPISAPAPVPDGPSGRAPYGGPGGSDGGGGGSGGGGWVDPRTTRRPDRGRADASGENAGSVEDADGDPSGEDDPDEGSPDEEQDGDSSGEDDPDEGSVDEDTRSDEDEAVPDDQDRDEGSPGEDTRSDADTSGADGGPGDLPGSGRSR